MSWFKRHLNWSYLIGFVVLYFGCFFVGGFMGGMGGMSDEAIMEMNAALDNTYLLVSLLIVSAIVIKAKKQSLWWLLLMFQLSPLWIANKSEGVEIEDGEYVSNTSILGYKISNHTLYPWACAGLCVLAGSIIGGIITLLVVDQFEAKSRKVKAN